MKSRKIVNCIILLVIALGVVGLVGSLICAGSIIDFLESYWKIIITIALSICAIVFGVFLLVESNSQKKIQFERERARIFEETSRDPLFEYFVKNDVLNMSYKDENNDTIRKKTDNYLAQKRYKEYIEPNFQFDLAAIIHDICENPKKVVVQYPSKLLCDDYQWQKLTLKGVSDSNGKVVSILARRENINSVIVERQKYKDKATLDFLTQVFNRATLIESSTQLIKEGYKSLSVIMLDIDDLKIVNDSCGHAQGDATLSEFSQKLKAVFTKDIIGRYGGDEFLVVIKDNTLEQLNQKIHKLFISISDSCDFALNKLTASAGAVWTENKVNLHNIINEADLAMYDIKQSGKNGYNITMEQADETIVMVEKKNFLPKTQE